MTTRMEHTAKTMNLKQYIKHQLIEIPLKISALEEELRMIEKFHSQMEDEVNHK